MNILIIRAFIKDLLLATNKKSMGDSSKRELSLKANFPRRST
jgi:hypothetical protein